MPMSPPSTANPPPSFTASGQTKSPRTFQLTGGLKSLASAALQWLFLRVASLEKKLQASPALVGSLPSHFCPADLSCQGLFGEASRYWFYLARPSSPRGWSGRCVVRSEMRWAFSWEAVVVGIVVCVFWVGLMAATQAIQGRHGLESPHPIRFRSLLLFIAFRIVGSTFVVPPRRKYSSCSFLYRYIIKPDFQSVPIGTSIDRIPGHGQPFSVWSTVIDGSSASLLRFRLSRPRLPQNASATP